MRRASRLASSCRRRCCVLTLCSKGLRPRRLCGWKVSSAYKGLTILALVTVASLITMLYTRGRFQTMTAEAFNMAVITQQPQPQQQVEQHGFQNAGITSSPLLLQELDAGPLAFLRDAQEGADPPANSLTDPQLDPSEVFPEEEPSTEAIKDIWKVMEEFEPISEMLLHFVWCGNRFFDFRNYVSLISAIDGIKPRKVMFHYKTLPMKDPNEYFTWFDALRERYSTNFVMVRINSTEVCYSGSYKRYALLFDILRQNGGIYAPEDSIFVRILDRHRVMKFVSGVSSCNLNYFFEGLVLAKKGQYEIPLTEKAQVRKLSVCKDPASMHPCSPDVTYRQASAGNVPTCVRLTTAIFPKDIWDRNDPVSTLAKYVAYGKTDLQPRRNNQSILKTPRLAHYLCTDDCMLSFSGFISILSALHVGGLQRVLIHGPTAPSGVWWDKLNTDPRAVASIIYIHRDFTFSQNPKLQMSNEMMRYIMRTEILLHYGGVFHDGHVIWTQPLPEQLLEYDAVASPDWHVHGDWPESVNHALLIARPGAQYLNQLLKMFRENAKNEKPWLVDHYFSYRLIELDPTLVYLYPHLQVKCLNHNCHPTWQPGYRSHFQVNRPGQEFSWRTETLTVHWQDSFPELDLDQIRFTSGFIVDITKYVIHAAGLDIHTL